MTIRILIHGKAAFFDRDTFVEALGGWAKTVVVGRARLGGIPMGVIVTENRTSEALKPADPADATSQERMVQQAGGVWFPDSAYKTAQALKDFNREALPCMIFANWRGFSGGQRDMFDEVLKFGSMIVDALVDYKQPIFVYIPPFAELRGGAWVVVDSTINSDVMEFYAADEARGGVLEAAGAASIKFRVKDVLASAHRLDPVLCQLDEQMKSTKAVEDKKRVLIEIKTREKMIVGVYSQVAVHFADLHDTPGRMKAKNVIREVVSWSQARKYFYYRLRRRLTEIDLVKNMKTLSPTIASRDVMNDFEKWLLKRANIAKWNDDRHFVDWIKEHPNDIQMYLSSQRDSAISDLLGDTLLKIISVSNVSGNTINIVKSALAKLSDAEREAIMTAFK